MTLGRVPALSLHVLSLLLHALNGYLIGVMCRRLFPERTLMMWLAMALYITFPFSYQAIPYVAAMGHIEAATGFLLAVLCLDHWWETRNPLWLGGIALSVGLANFSHEAGVVASALLAAWLLFTRYNLSVREMLSDWKTVLTGLAPAIMVNVFYLLIWRQLSNNPADPVDILSSIPHNLNYFAQGLAYPITQFGFWLSTDAGLPDQIAALILSVIGIVILVAGLMRFHDRCLWIGIAWLGITVLAPTILSDWFYVLTAPHLLMMASPGIALVWAGALDAFWTRRHPVGQAAAVLIGALALIGGMLFANQVRLVTRAYLIPERSLVAVDLIMQTIDGQVAEKLFVHLLCGETIVAQADGALMGETYPYDYWQAGETWHEIRLMELPTNIPADCLAVRIGQYHPVTGARPTLPDGSEWTIIPVAP